MRFDTHQPRKRFGQNFLRDPRVIDKIISTINPNFTEKIVEIGPGRGAITEPLLAKVQHLEVVEIDRDLAEELQRNFGKSNKLTIHVQDALKFNLAELNKSSSEKNISDEKIRIIGNLPYNISTPLIFHLLKSAALIKDMHFMLQKEVVERLCAAPNNKNYGRLSIMTQYYCQTISLFIVSAQSFFPKPKVESAFVRLTPHLKPQIVADDPELLKIITRTAFNQRRKTLSNSLKGYLKTEDFHTLNLDPSARPETLTVSEFVLISNYINKLASEVPKGPTA